MIITRFFTLTRSTVLNRNGITRIDSVPMFFRHETQTAGMLRCWMSGKTSNSNGSGKNDDKDGFGLPSSHSNLDSIKEPDMPKTLKENDKNINLISNFDLKKGESKCEKSEQKPKDKPIDGKPIVQSGSATPIQNTPISQTSANVTNHFGITSASVNQPIMGPQPKPNQPTSFGSSETSEQTFSSVREPEPKLKNNSKQKLDPNPFHDYVKQIEMEDPWIVPNEKSHLPPLWSNINKPNLFGNEGDLQKNKENKLTSKPDTKLKDQYKSMGTFASNADEDVSAIKKTFKKPISSMFASVVDVDVPAMKTVEENLQVNHIQKTESKAEQKLKPNSFIKAKPENKAQNQKNESERKLEPNSFIKPKSQTQKPSWILENKYKQPELKSQEQLKPNSFIKPKSQATLKPNSFIKPKSQVTLKPNSFIKPKSQAATLKDPVKPKPQVPIQQQAINIKELLKQKWTKVTTQSEIKQTNQTSSEIPPLRSHTWFMSDPKYASMVCKEWAKTFGLEGELKKLIEKSEALKLTKDSKNKLETKLDTKPKTTNVLFRYQPANVPYRVVNIENIVKKSKVPKRFGNKSKSKVSTTFIKSSSMKPRSKKPKLYNWELEPSMMKPSIPKQTKEDKLKPNENYHSFFNKNVSKVKRSPIQKDTNVDPKAVYHSFFTENSSKVKRSPIQKNNDLEPKTVYHAFFGEITSKPKKSAIEKDTPSNRFSRTTPWIDPAIKAKNSFPYIVTRVLDHPSLLSKSEKLQKLESHLRKGSESSSSSSMNSGQGKSGNGNNCQKDKLVQFDRFRVGFVGAGNIVDALCRGLIRSGNFKPNQIYTTAPSNSNIIKFRELGCNTHNENSSIFNNTNGNSSSVSTTNKDHQGSTSPIFMLFICVKPYIPWTSVGFWDFLTKTTFTSAVGSSPVVLISTMAGVPLSVLKNSIDSHFKGDIPYKMHLARIMPNTASAVNQGSIGLTLHESATPFSNEIVSMLRTLGHCQMVSEDQMDAVVGVAGSGIAYVYSMIQAMADGGVLMGLPREIAVQLAAQTVKGAASMVLESGMDPISLRNNVCSPGGTTINGVLALENGQFNATIMRAVEAATKKSREFSKMPAPK